MQHVTWMHKTDPVAVDLLLFCMRGCSVVLCQGSPAGREPDSAEASPHAQKAERGLTCAKSIIVWNDTHP